MKKKTSISLDESTLAKLQSLADNESRSVSSVLNILIEASAKIAEDAAGYGHNVKQIADAIKRTGDEMRQDVIE